MTDRRDAADRESGQLISLPSRRPTDIALTGDGGQPGEIDPVMTGDEAENRVKPAIVTRGDKDKRFDDLAELGTDRFGGLGRGMGRLIEDLDVEDDALPRGCVANSLDPDVVGLGHGRSLASGERRAAAVASPDMQAVLFDWDGTLVDSLGAFHRANSVVMASFGLPFDEVVYRRNYAPDWRLMYLRLGVPDNRLDEANELWHATYAGESEILAFDGVAAALKRLQDAGSRLGIVTAGHRDVVLPQLEQTGLAGLLETRVFGDDLAVQKPDPGPLWKALQLLDLGDRPADVAYLGDAPTDMQMARTVGVRAVGIASVLGDPDELRAAGAAEVSPSVADWVAGHLAT